MFLCEKKFLGEISLFELKNIVGNKNLILSIQRSIVQKRNFHSYIIHGKKNSGKLFLTNCLAKFILCQNEKKNHDVCNNCYSCHSFEEKNNPDIIYVRPTKTNFIAVDDIREQIKEKANIKPYVCKYKIFILEDADKMTLQAQNALLKILEEPPSFVIFFLLGDDKKNFLPTIISRCAVLKTDLIDLQEIKNYLLENYKEKNESIIDVCCNYSGGNLGQALILLNDEIFFALREKIIDFMISLKKNNLAQAINFVKEFEMQKENIDLIFDIIYSWFADLFFYSQTSEINFLKNPDKINQIQKTCELYDSGILYEKLKSVEKAKRYLGYNVNFKLDLTGFLIDLFLD